AARLFCGAAAGRPQRGQPAGRAGLPHRGTGGGPDPDRRAGRGGPLRGGAGGNGGKRGAVRGADGGVLPAGSAPRLWARPGRAPAGGRTAIVGDLVAGGGRTVRFQRAAHRRKYAGARLPDRLSGAAERGGDPVRQSEGDGTALVNFPFGLLGSLGVLL